MSGEDAEDQSFGELLLPHEFGHMLKLYRPFLARNDSRLQIPNISPFQMLPAPTEGTVAEVKQIYIANLGV